MWYRSLLLALIPLTVPASAAAPAERPNGGSRPCWSPDGSKIAFLSATPNSPVDVWVWDAVGAQMPRRLTRLGARWVAWSTDSSKVFCQTSRGGASAFYAVDIGSGREERVLQFLGPDVAVAAWSPDGSRVAFLQPHGDHRDVWVADVSGTNVRQLSENLPVRSVAWSPDGREIAFDLTAAGGAGVGVVASDGSEEPRGLFPGMATDPSWAPDGSRVAVVGMHTVTLVTRDGKDERRLHISQADRSYVDWSPDGTRLLFTSGDAKDPGIAVVDIASEAVQPLIKRWTQATMARWSPDGRWIAFEGRPPGGGGLSLGLLDTTNGRAQVLTPARPSYWGSSWVQGGRGVLYFSDHTPGGRPGLCRWDRRSGSRRALLGLDPRTPVQVSWPDRSAAGIAVVGTRVWVLPPDGPARPLLATEHPTWGALSPTGAELAYVKWQARRPSLVLRQMDSGQETELVPAREDGGGLSRATWAPGGNALAYIADAALVVVDRSGKRQTLFEIPGFDQPAMLFTPTWSPDGQWIAVGFFTRGDGQKFRVLLLDSETGAARVLAQCEVVAEPGRLADPLGAAPAWSPDGQRLAYVVEDEGSPAVYVAEAGVASGSTPQLLRRSAAYPAWSTDGRRVLMTLLDGQEERLAEIDVASGRVAEIRPGMARPYPVPETAEN